MMSSYRVLASKYSLVMSSCFPLLQRYTHKFNNKQKQKLSLALCPRLNINLSLGKKHCLTDKDTSHYKMVVLFCRISIEERYFRIIYHNLLGGNSLPPSRHALSRKRHIWIASVFSTEGSLIGFLQRAFLSSAVAHPDRGKVLHVSLIIVHLNVRYLDKLSYTPA